MSSSSTPTGWLAVLMRSSRDVGANHRVAGPPAATTAQSPRHRHDLRRHPPPRQWNPTTTTCPTSTCPSIVPHLPGDVPRSPHASSVQTHRRLLRVRPSRATPGGSPEGGEHRARLPGATHRRHDCAVHSQPPATEFVLAGAVELRRRSPKARDLEPGGERFSLSPAHTSPLASQLKTAERLASIDGSAADNRCRTAEIVCRRMRFRTETRSVGSPTRSFSLTGPCRCR